MICPKDFEPCCDSICRSSGCLHLDGAPLYEKCACGALVSAEDRKDCTCDMDDWIEEDERNDS